MCRTIQAALDNSNCVEGDTILVKPGIYDEGGWVNTLGFFCAGTGYADVSAFKRHTFGTMFYRR